MIPAPDRTIRMGHWPATSQAKETFSLFPGVIGNVEVLVEILEPLAIAVDNLIIIKAGTSVLI